MHYYTGILTTTAPPRRKGLPRWLIVMFVVIALVAVSAAAIFVLRPYLRGLHAMQTDLFVMYVASGDTDEVNKHLVANPSLVNVVSSFELSPLGMAASNGDLAIMQLLIARKADVNGRAHAGYSPLHEAAVANQTEAATLLLTSGAQIDAGTDTGLTPLHLAAWMGKAEVAAVLIDHGADVNSEDHDGATPLHSAVKISNTDIVEMLIANGAHVNAKKNDGSTPLKNALELLANLDQLSPNEIKARTARMERDRQYGRLLFERPTSERCRQVIAILRQHGGEE